MGIKRLATIASVLAAVTLGGCASGGAIVNTTPVAVNGRYEGPYAWGGLDRLAGRTFIHTDWTISSDDRKTFRWQTPGEVLAVDHVSSGQFIGTVTYSLDPATGLPYGYRLHSDGSLVSGNDGDGVRTRIRVLNDEQFQETLEENVGGGWQVPYMGGKTYTSTQQRAQNAAERDAFWGGLASGALTMAQTYADTQTQINARTDAARAYTRPMSGPVPYSSAAPSTTSARGASAGVGSPNSAGATAQNAGRAQAGAGSAGAQNSGRVIPIQFYYTIPMRPLDSDTRNRVCRSNIVALSDRVDQDSQASRQQAMAIAGRYRASFLEKCNRLGTTYDVGNLQLTIHGMNTRGTEPFVNPSHPSDYRVTLP